MAEDLVPHIMLNPRPHHMAVIGNIKVTVHFNQNHSNHQNTEADNLTRCLLQRLFHNRTRNIPYNQWNHQCNGCSKHCKKHVGKKQSLIWNVIPRQLADSSLLFSGFFFFLLKRSHTDIKIPPVVINLQHFVKYQSNLAETSVDTPFSSMDTP